MFVGPRIEPVAPRDVRDRRIDARWERAERYFADAVPTAREHVSVARCHAIDDLTYARYVLDPDLTVEDVVRLAFERARSFVDLDAWEERRRARAEGNRLVPEEHPISGDVAPVPADAMDLEDDGTQGPPVASLPLPPPAPNKHHSFKITTLEAEMRHDDGARGHGTSAAPLTPEDVLREPLLDAYALDPLPGGETLHATLVNAVYMTFLGGSLASVPWLAGTERTRVLPTAAVAQALLGIVCPYSASNNRCFCIRYTAPLGTKHGIFPLDMSIHETAASNDVLSELAVNLTTALMSVACGLPYLRVVNRQRHNCVFTAYAPYPIDYTLLKEDYPAMVEIKDSDFKSTVCSLPQLNDMKLLVFSNRPIILVGARNAHDMKRAMAVFLPKIYATCLRGMRLAAAATAQWHGNADDEEAGDGDDLFEDLEHVDGTRPAKRARLE